jgi:hypothetical protein
MTLYWNVDMKIKDLLFIAALILLFLPFFVVDSTQHWFLSWSRDHALIMSFLKFAVLATLGEVIGLRIRTGDYNEPNFGILPRALVWGLFGLTIKMAFDIFSTGAVAFIANLDLTVFKGLDLAAALNQGPMSPLKLLLAFAVSVTMNLIYAPMLMTLHKITDTHIISIGGKLSGLFRPIQFGEILSKINWEVMWNFIYKKTIPFFWIPAHTVTFLLPPLWRVLFAALLGVVLGVFLSIASLMSRK